MTQRKPHRGLESGRRWSAWTSLAALVAALAMAAGVVAFLSLFTELPSGAPLLALVMLGVPLLVFVLTSDRVAELHAPGGWKLVFRGAANRLDRRQDLTQVHAVPVHDADPREVEDRYSPPNSIRLDLPVNSIETQLCLYLGWARERGEAVRWLVIFTNGKLWGFLPLSSIRLDPQLTALTNRSIGLDEPIDAAKDEGDDTCRAHELISWLEDDDRPRLQRLVGYVGADDAGGMDWTRSQLLEEMFERRLDSLPVVDEDNHLVGVAERSRMTEALLVELAHHAEAERRT